MDDIKGRVIYSGHVSGEVLRSDAPIGFFGHVDIKTGILKEPDHPLFGKSLAGKVLVFPHARGSTVGSYILYGLKKYGKAPAAMILTECEVIVAVGAIIAEIPTVDRVNIKQFSTGDQIAIHESRIRIQK